MEQRGIYSNPYYRLPRILSRSMLSSNEYPGVKTEGLAHFNRGYL